MHPGPNDEKQIVRWTAPSSGAYTIKSTFTRMHTGDTDVHILMNGTSIFSKAVTARNKIAAFSKALTSIKTGDTIDFVVGFGSDRNYFSDSTRLQAVITPTCEKDCAEEMRKCFKQGGGRNCKDLYEQCVADCLN